MDKKDILARCNVCGGTGWIRWAIYPGENSRSRCSKCGGTGFIIYHATSIQ